MPGVMKTQSISAAARAVFPVMVVHDLEEALTMGHLASHRMLGGPGW